DFRETPTRTLGRQSSQCARPRPLAGRKLCAYYRQKRARPVAHKRYGQRRNTPAVELLPACTRHCCCCDQGSEKLARPTTKYAYGWLCARPCCGHQGPPRGDSARN
ncbi:unnamed protein product, partial [Ectocarpus sp. 12 AP-2014]